MLPDIASARDQFHSIGICQLADKGFVQVRFLSSQLMIQVKDRNDESHLLTHFEHEAKKRNRIRSSRNGNAHAVSSPEQFVFAGVQQHRLDKLVHGSMVHPCSCEVLKPTSSD